MLGLVLLASIAANSSGLSLNQESLSRLDQGLIAYWSFDEQEGDIIFDATENYNDARIVGAVWNEEGNALRFDGEAYVFVPHDNSLLPREAITLSAWVRILGAVPKYHGILGKDGYASGYRLLIHGTNKKVVFQLTGEKEYNLWSSTTIADDQWHFIVATYDGSKMKLYIDGVKDPTEKDREGPIDANTNPVMIGKPQYAFNGLIDEIRVYNRALGEEEVRALFRTGR